MNIELEPHTQKTTNTEDLLLQIERHVSGITPQGFEPKDIMIELAGLIGDRYLEEESDKENEDNEKSS